MLYKIVLGAAVLVALLFVVLIFFTSKGDAMSGGGGSIRTSFKGKASFDDQVGKLAVFLGVSFMGLMLVLDILASRGAQ